MLFFFFGLSSSGIYSGFFFIITKFSNIDSYTVIYSSIANSALYSLYIYINTFHHNL